MMDLFTKTAFDCSELITKQYSTSFSLGIRTLAKKYRKPVYAIYGFVRYADEIVDTFHEHNKKDLLERFEKETYKAIEEGISLNPVLHSFQSVVNEFKVDHQLIAAFLQSMWMDLDKKTYQEGEYEAYIYGSAEVVGLMCLSVFCEGDEKHYQSLLVPARHLGSAFQKVNFLRDLKSDFDERGRVYFPGVDFDQFSEKDKENIERDIHHDFKESLSGIKNLPRGARAGVYLAYIYYLALFRKITKLSHTRIKTERIRVPDFNKLILFFRCYFCHKLNLIV